MKLALVLACGNTLRGDDGVGQRVAEELRQQLGERQTEILCSHQWTPELAENISKAEIAIFVDASATVAPGQVHVRTVAATSERVGPTTHSLNPERLLGLAQSLYGRVPDAAYLLTIGGQAFEPGEKLSVAVQQAIPGAVARLKSLLADFRSRQP
jgi:hydrogenase maturation protease